MLDNIIKKPYESVDMLNRNFALEAVRVTEYAAVASSAWIGRGERDAADQAAVNAMRESLNQMDIDGTIVIGEGERDKAPMLYIGEKSVMEMVLKLILHLIHLREQIFVQQEVQTLWLLLHLLKKAVFYTLLMFIWRRLQSVLIFLKELLI